MKDTRKNMLYNESNKYTFRYFLLKMNYMTSKIKSLMHWKAFVLNRETTSFNKVKHRSISWKKCMAFSFNRILIHALKLFLVKLSNFFYNWKVSGLVYLYTCYQFSLDMNLNSESMKCISSKVGLMRSDAAFW